MNYPLGIPLIPYRGNAEKINPQNIPTTINITRDFYEEQKYTHIKQEPSENYANYTHKKATNDDEEEPLLLLDSGSDICAIGGTNWQIDEITHRQIDLTGFSEDNKSTNVKIGSAITATDLPDGTTILLKINEAALIGEKGSSLLSTMQARDYGTKIHDIPKTQGGIPYLAQDGKIIPVWRVGKLAR